MTSPLDLLAGPPSFSDVLGGIPGLTADAADLGPVISAANPLTKQEIFVGLNSPFNVGAAAEPTTALVKTAGPLLLAGLALALVMRRF